MTTAFPAVMSQPQNKEAPMTSIVSKIGPSCDFRTDPLPLVSALSCGAAGEQGPTFSSPAPRDPSLPFRSLLPTGAARTAPGSYGKLMNETHCKNQGEISPKAREGYQPRDSSPVSPSLLPPPRTPCPPRPPRQHTGDLGWGGKSES